MYLSYHCCAQIILHPWGHTNNKTCDEDGNTSMELLDSLAEIGANAMYEVNGGNVYAIGQPGCDLLYNVSGTRPSNKL